MIRKALLGSKLPRAPQAPSGVNAVQIEGYWVPTGPLEPQDPPSYVLTSTVRNNLRDLARAAACGRHPVLLQGETSAGKTSLVRWLAARTGHICVRVNNHEHTDLEVLSRAFRNRFLEMHFEELPPGELEDILEKRCSLPRSLTAKMVGVMTELQLRRRETGVFAGRHGYMTLRDLFRWAERYRRTPDPGTFYDWDQFLANE
ncbi:hypothetical protein V5799_020294, partial [Amblyomma americanum]